jgi:2-phospho-L-lactate transferase/gluconeogenesis factor (CofD/UPF0052 family)
VVPHILPMTDQRAETKIVTNEGVLHFRNIWCNDAPSSCTGVV